MITVERRSDHEEYSKVTDGVLLHVKHSLSATEVKRILEIHIATTGVEAARRTLGPLLGSDENSTRGPYMCVVEGGGAPKVEHTSHAAAAAEAMRLAIHTGRTTHVLRSIAKYIPKSEVEVVPS